MIEGDGNDRIAINSIFWTKNRIFLLLTWNFRLYICDDHSILPLDYSLDPTSYKLDGEMYIYVPIERWEKLEYHEKWHF